MPSVLAIERVGRSGFSIVSRRRIYRVTGARLFAGERYFRRLGIDMERLICVVYHLLNNRVSGFAPSSART